MKSELNQTKRAATIDPLKRLKAPGVPLDALGIQSHISAGNGQIWGKGLRDLISQAQSMGLEVYLTELDVNDDAVAGAPDSAADTAERDNIVASAYGSYLSVALDNTAIKSVLTWGLTDKALLAQRHQEPPPNFPTVRSAPCPSTPPTNPLPPSSSCATPSTAPPTASARMQLWVPHVPRTCQGPGRMSLISSRHSGAGKIMNLSRREFTRLTALGLAARFTPSPHRPNRQPQKIGYAVIGIGRIADHFLRGSLLTTNSTITGLVSGHRDKADKFAAQYDVPQNSIYNYENFDEILKNPAVDAVYVALPNSMHAEYTIRAAKAGKHVLCEKPMATSIADCEKMIAACKAANVKLMIAYRCHYEPTNLRAIKLIRDGALGQVPGHRKPLRLQHQGRRMATRQKARRRRPHV